MTTEWRIFGGVAGFLYLATVIYGWWSWYQFDSVEWIGTIALVLSGTLCLMCGLFFWFVSRRIDPRPEDRPDAEIAEGAGEMGFFSPGSYWPVGIALAAAVAAVGMAYWLWWLIAAGMIGAVVGASALLFEYYTGTRRPAEH